MKILVIGSGGREHAICWKLKQSTLVSELYCAPGNPGIASVAENLPIKVGEIDSLVEKAKSLKIDLVVVGPEVPLAMGIVDRFQKEGIAIFGPTQKAAELESSKAFAKEVMIEAGVPTAKYCCFEKQEAALAYCNSQPVPIVLKADSLAAGKGVVICKDRAEVSVALKFIFDELKAPRVVVEECLSGVEVSYIVAAAGERIVPLCASHDYKRIFDGNLGPNTGGMGTVSPTPYLNSDHEKFVLDKIVSPVLKVMKNRGTPFVGFLYVGLMITDDGIPKVIEFNARLGDPETQVIMRRMKGDFAAVLNALSTGEEPPMLSWSSEAAVCVVLAAKGYPENPINGDPITGIENASQIPSVAIFHAGTGVKDNKLVTAGGRVLNITATGKDLLEAKSLAYRAADMVQFNGRQMRRDIGGTNRA